MRVVPAQRMSTKTSLKFTRPVRSDTVQWSGIYSTPNPTLSNLDHGTTALRFPQANRSWTDRNNNYIPDCDFSIRP